MPRVDEKGQLLFEGRSQTLEPFPDSTPEVIDGFKCGKAYGWTLSYGIAAFQLFASDFLDMTELQPSDDAAPALRRIWPLRARTAWPPPVRLTAAVGHLPQLPRAFLPGTNA